MTFQDPHFVHGSHGQSKKVNQHGLADFFKEIRERHPLHAITFLCIGTDRSTGDALGPLLGSELLAYGFPHVIGTLPSPCDALNLVERIATIPKEHIVIAVDACLGHPSSVGSFLVSEESLVPARSVGQNLPAVGNYSVAAVVNVNGPKPYWTLQMTSLFFVMKLARQIAEAAAAAFGRPRLADDGQATVSNSGSLD